MAHEREQALGVLKAPRGWLKKCLRRVGGSAADGFEHRQSAVSVLRGALHARGVKVNIPEVAPRKSSRLATGPHALASSAAVAMIPASSAALRSAPIALAGGAWGRVYSSATRPMT